MVYDIGVGGGGLRGIAPWENTTHSGMPCMLRFLLSVGRLFGLDCQLATQAADKIGEKMIKEDGDVGQSITERTCSVSDKGGLAPHAPLWEVKCTRSHGSSVE